MTLDPAAERARIYARYPRFGWRDGAFYAATVAVVAIVSLFRSVDWWIIASMLVGLVWWEATKHRLRRNADRFSASSG